MKRKNPLAAGTKQKGHSRPGKQGRPRTETGNRVRKSTRPASTRRGGNSRGEVQSEIRLELTLKGSTAWKLLRLLVVLASVGSSPFVFRRSMDALWAPGASTVSAPGASKEGAQRAHLESGR